MCSNDKYTEYGTVYMAWDTLDAGPGGRNNLESYNEGAAMLLHELFHHLGLQHTFGTQPDDVRYNTCSDDDGVADTPSAFGACARVRVRGHVQRDAAAGRSRTLENSRACA